MSAKKFIRLVAGQLAEVFGIVVSTGAPNDGDLVALDSTGRLDLSVLPVGIGPDTASIVASETLTAGQLVNIWDNSGVPNVRKADCSNGRRAHGFVLSGYASSATALVYFAGEISGLSALTNGVPMYLSTAGAASATPPSTTGYISQDIGEAISTTTIQFQPSRTITLA